MIPPIAEGPAMPQFILPMSQAPEPARMLLNKTFYKWRRHRQTKAHRLNDL